MSAFNAASGSGSGDTKQRPAGSRLSYGIDLRCRSACSATSAYAAVLLIPVSFRAAPKLLLLFRIRRSLPPRA